MEKVKKNLEKRYNVWFYVAALYVSYFVGNYLQNEMTIYGIIGQFNMLMSLISNNGLPYLFVVMLKLLIPLVQVGLFELFSRVFFGLSNSFSFGSVNMKSNDFVAALRIFVIMLNLALGLLNLLYYLFNFLIPLGFIVLTFMLTTAAYFMFFIYINKHYLDKKTAHRAFRTMSMLYLAITFFNLAGGIIL